MSGNNSGTSSCPKDTSERKSFSEKVDENEANAESSFNANDEEDILTNLDKYPKKLNEEKQGKHIPGHPNFHLGKSELAIPMGEVSRLISLFSGKGTPIGDNKERVNFGMIIGIYKDPVTGVGVPTSIGIIHYSKTGLHIVPARPKGE